MVCNDPHHRQFKGKVNHKISFDIIVDFPNKSVIETSD